MDADKSIRTEVLETGHHRFVQLEQELNSPGDGRKLAEEFSGGEYQNSVVKLTVCGRLDPEEYDEWLEIGSRVRKNCLELEMVDAAGRRKVNVEQNRKELSEG